MVLSRSLWQGGPANADERECGRRVRTLPGRTSGGWLCPPLALRALRVPQGLGCDSLNEHVAVDQLITNNTTKHNQTPRVM